MADFFDGKLRYFLEHGQMAYLFYIVFGKLNYYILPIISYNHPKNTAVQQKLMQELVVKYSDHSERILKCKIVCDTVYKPCSSSHR